MVSLRRTSPPLRRGALLVDVIVATIILGSSVVAILGVVGRAISAQSNGEELRTAAMLLDEQLNTILMLGPDDYASRGTVEGRCEPPFQDYSYSITLTGGIGGDPYLVRATLSWMSGGRLRTESIETFIAPRLGDDPDPDRRPAERIGRDY